MSRVSLDDCDVPDSIVLAGGELAFDSRAIPHAVAHYAGSVDVPSHDRRRLVALNGGFVSVEGGRPGRLPGRIAGADGASLGEPVAVDSGQILTEHPNGRVALLDLDGRVLRVFSPGGRGETPPVYGERRPPTAGLWRRDLVVLRGGRLTWFDAASGRRRGVVRIDRRAAFAGVARGLAAYVADDVVHVVRLRDGREADIRPRGAAVRARLTAAGLFYSSQRRALEYRRVLRHAWNPARVVFVRRSFLESRLR